METYSQPYICGVALNNAGIAFLERGNCDSAIQCFQDAAAAMKLSLMHTSTGASSEHKPILDLAWKEAKQNLDERIGAVSRVMCTLAPKNEYENPGIKAIADNEWDTSLSELFQSGFLFVRIEMAALVQDIASLEVECEITSAIILHNLGTISLLRLGSFSSNVVDLEQQHKLHNTQRALKASLKIVQDSQRRHREPMHEDPILMRQAVCLTAVLHSLVFLFCSVGATDEAQFYSRVLHDLRTSMNQYCATIGGCIHHVHRTCASAA